ncbi:hypothetical protein AMELA_G00170970 [Ameiurus melas]|uniref:Uncharacterized protein n=1 Tax=Ameiurus melas TaxID=219545 RepID=A0A7J6AG31_AMEME|nr:hypothetical protein AMELA_G00170970 [Ameiurus melas]
MRDLIKIVNDIRSKVLSHWQFKVLLDEMDLQYGDVLYHQEKTSLSREAGMMTEKVPGHDAVLSDLIQEFNSRFEDFRPNAADFDLFAQPFTISVDTVSDDIQMELIELQCDSELEHKFPSLDRLLQMCPSKHVPKDVQTGTSDAVCLAYLPL